MRLSCSTRCLPDEPLERVLTAIREAGYAAFEPSWWRMESDDRETAGHGVCSPGIPAKYGLTVSGLRVGQLTAVSPGDLREELVDLRYRMKLARILGLKAVNLRGGDRRHQSLEMFAVALEAILAIADEMRMNICLANACDSRVEQIEDLRYLLRAVDHPRLLLLNDTGQFHSAAVNPRYLLTEFGERLAIVHISDQIGKRAVPIGRGEMNVPAIVEHLAQIGYDGWLVVDQQFTDYADAVNLLTDNRLTLERLLDANKRHA